MPLFTIATVTLNNAQGIEKTWKSIQKQRFKDLEWLVQDGGSNDKSLNLLKQTPAAVESRTDKGIYDAMNKLIERATGDYILFLNAGDTFATADTLSIIAEYTKEKADFIYGNALEEEKGNKYFKPARSHKHLALGMFTHHQAMLYNRKAINEMRYNIDYSIAADYEFTARFLQTANAVKYMNHTICVFEAGGISQQQTVLGRDEQFQVRKQLKLCSPIQNHTTRGLQALNMVFRTYLPSLFWALKPQQSSNNIAL